MKPITTKFITVCTFVLLAVSALTPTTANAQAVSVISDTSPTNIKTSIESTISAAADTITAGGIASLNIKEFTLDGIAYGIARTMIQQMVQSIISWINSGFQGSPAFVTDLGEFLQGVSDQVVSDFLMGSELAFLCSPFQLDVKAALATEYNKTRSGYQPQCTLDDVANNMQGFLEGSFQDGGWDSWFELTQRETNDPNAAYFDAQIEMNAAIRNQQGEEIELLDWGDGFLSFKTCSDAGAQGGDQSNCQITTPGRVIADQLNGALGAGRDQLITADEINEIIGALLAQLAQQALTGMNGLLGLGGNSSYTNYDYPGSDGTSSYIDSLETEQPVDTGLGSSTREVPIEQAMQRTEDYIEAQEEIVARLDEAKDDYDDIDDSTSCNLPDWPDSFEDERADAAAAIQQYEFTIVALEELRERFLVADTPQEQADIQARYSELENDGLIPSIIDATEVELYIEYDLTDDITEFEEDVQQARARCASG